MPTPWSDVAASPQYQALAPADQEAARQQYFDQVVAPRVPADQREAARAQFDAQTRGTTPMGPGLGKTATPTDQEREHEAGEFIRAANGPGDIESIPGQFLAGGYEMGLGLTQLGTHLSLLPQALRAAGLPNPIDPVDDEVRRFQAAQASDPGAQTAGGKAARGFGSFVATLPLSVASIPAKGAPFLPALGRTVAGGALTAGATPVNPDNFVADKTTQMLVGGALAGGVAAGARGAMRVAEHLNPANTAAQVVNLPNYLANKTAYAAEGEDLAQRTGIRMTPGQVSGSRVQTGVENMARQSFLSADRALQADQRIAEDTVRYVRAQMDKLSREPAGEAVIGTKIQSVTRAAVEKIAAQRERVAGQQYGAIDKMLNGRAFVRPDAVRREADAIIAEYGAVPTPEAKRIVQQAQALKDALAKKEAYTFTEAQRSRGYFGKGARGGTNVFDDVSSDLNRTFATRLFKAFDADIEASANALNGRGPGLVPHGTLGLADAIKQANANYRQYSQLIEYTKASPIARLFGDSFKVGDVAHLDQLAPETVLQRLGNMKPTELQMVSSFMRQNDPATWQQYKRLLIDNALADARTLPTSAGANVVPFNSSRFLRALGGDKPEKIKQLQAIFDPTEFREIDEAFNVARRLGDRFGYNGSGTGPYGEAAKLFETLRSLSYRAAATAGGEVIGLRKIANVMLNADGRRALVKLSTLPPGSRQAASLLGLISALMAGQNYPGSGVNGGAGGQEGQRQ